MLKKSWLVKLHFYKSILKNIRFDFLMTLLPKLSMLFLPFTKFCVKMGLQFLRYTTAEGVKISVFTLDLLILWGLQSTKILLLPSKYEIIFKN